MKLKFTHIAPFFLLALLFNSENIQAQFDPAGGKPGSKAIHVNSGRITTWAKQVSLKRGWVDISDTSQGKVVLGSERDAYSKADKFVVSLGDGGEATLYFENGIPNQDGEDFAVFENGFSFMDGYFLELAFVEVSKNGRDYYRFPSTSLTDTIKQKDNGSIIRPVDIHNLAGKHQANYGTPFDLEDLKDSLAEDIDSIYYIKIIDVIGSIVDSLATRDSKGNIINDPWPTPFHSGGFDLDAVALLGGVLDVDDVSNETLLYPNPAESGSKIWTNLDFDTYEIFNLKGELILESSLNSKHISTSNLGSGIYMVKLRKNNKEWISRLQVY